MPYNVTSGYCHKPNKAKLKDEDQNSNDVRNATEKGKGHNPLFFHFVSTELIMLYFVL